MRAALTAATPTRVMEWTMGSERIGDPEGATRAKEGGAKAGWIVLTSTNKVTAMTRQVRVEVKVL